MFNIHFRIRLRVVFLFLLFLPSLLVAQAPTPSTQPAVSQADLKTLQDAIHAAQMNADNAWMLVSAALVLLMTGPGLAFSTGAWCGAKTFSAP